eukprot:gene13061-8191_t
MLGLKSKIDEETKQLGGTKNILSLSYSDDKEVILMLSIMFNSLDILYMASNGNPLIVIVNALVALYLYLTEGLTHNAALGLGIAGFVYSFFFKEKSGFELTQASEKLFSQDVNPKYNVVAVHFLLGVGNLTGGNHKKQVYHLEAAMKYAQNHGEFLFGSYSTNHGSINTVLNGENFNSLLPKLKKRQGWLKQVKNFFISDFMEVQIHFVMDLAGIMKYNPQFAIPIIRTLKCTDTFIPTMEGILAYHKGDYENALKSFEVAEPFADNEKGLVDYYELKLYHCLTMTNLYKATKEEKHLEKIQKFLQEMKEYASLGAEYIEPRYKLMKLYFRSTQISDQLSTVSELEEVLESATTFGLITIAAVISEVILEISDENNFPKAYSRLYFNSTMKIWTGLSAKTKIDQIKKKYSKYLGSYMRRSSSVPSTSIHAFSTSVQTSDST